MLFLVHVFDSERIDEYDGFTTVSIFSIFFLACDMYYNKKIFF